jgi:hypothetical protein
MFRDASRRLPALPTGHYRGIAASDIDHDGQFEILIASASGPNRALKWLGGQLRDVTPPLLADADHSTIGILAADFDADGEEELLVVNESRLRLIKDTPEGQWRDLLAGQDLRGAGQGNVADRRGVGKYGCLLGNRFLELIPDGSLSDIAKPIGLGRCESRAVLAGPLHGPMTDLVAGGELFRNNGQGLFERTHWFGKSEHASRVDGGSGRPGLFLSAGETPHRLLMRRAESWRDVATPSLALPSDLRMAVAADFDNDGREELLLVNHRERNRLFRLGEETQMLDPGDAAEADRSNVAAVVADLDGDGTLELILTHSDGTPSLYKPIAPATNHWLRIRPLTRLGAPARGATVLAVVRGRPMIRVIDCGNGGSQNEPVAHFGLGRDHADSVTITWPDGAGITLPRPDVNCTYRVPYPRG